MESGPKNPLVALMAACDEDHTLNALQAVRAVSSTEDEQAPQEHEEPVDAPEDAETAHPEASEIEHGHRHHEEQTDYMAADMDVDRMKVVPRLSTPERIRRRASRLYVEIHELIDRYEERRQREREHEKRMRTQGVFLPSAGTAADSSRRAAKTPNNKHKLPDLYKSFEEARRQHLQAAQSERSEFPPLSKPVAYSTKDPGAFSMRFQTLSDDYKKKR